MSEHDCCGGIRKLSALYILVALVAADLPIDCRYDDAIGTWTIKESARTGDPSLSCASLGAVAYTRSFTLHYPNTVTDEVGNVGTWTMVYNQGFEMHIEERSYWAPFRYYANNSYSCESLSTGWAHDTTVRHWSCFTASKEGVKEVLRQPGLSEVKVDLESQYINDLGLISYVNHIQDSWTAQAYPENEKYTYGEMIKRSGSKRMKRPTITRRATFEEKRKASRLPRNFDWRNIEGVNYVSPVRSQGNCGSCYTFSSTGMLESRIRIATNFSRQDIFSPQDVVDCSRISEGCNGGFGYLIAGRYAHEQGVVNEDCVPYKGHDDQCTTPSGCKRTYVSDYGYVGGYYGATNEEGMMLELLENGPIVIGIEVTAAFHNYKGGIYHEIKHLTGPFDPFYETNHSVFIVGYGVEPSTGEKFWIVKNSWGPDWGEHGYFRIRRGTNELGVESMAFAATVIP